MNLFDKLFNIELFEDTALSINRKQRSITKLFPTFYNRVDAVKNHGGIRLYKIYPRLWHFKVYSGTESGKTYDTYIQFQNIQELIERYAQDSRIWNKNKDSIDINKLAYMIFERVDLKIYCTCPAFSYWGSAYIATQRDAKYGKPENRPPKERNPRQYGLLCKHAQAVFDQLPFYTGTFAKHLNRYYRDMIKSIKYTGK